MACLSLRLIKDDTVGVAYVKEWDGADGDIYFARVDASMSSAAEVPVALSVRLDRRAVHAVQPYTVTNTGDEAITYHFTKTQAWTTVEPAAVGTLGHLATITVTVSIDEAANIAGPGNYNDTVTFANLTNGTGNTTRQVTLNVLALPGALTVTPANGLTSTGVIGGPFTPSSQAYSLQNTGGTAINWTCSNVQAWTTLSAASGTLAAGASVMVTASINAAANALAAGAYNDTVTFTNTTNGTGNTTRAVVLTVTNPGVLAVTPAGGLTSTGPVGGPFTPSSQAYTLQNTGGAALNWTCTNIQPWTTLSATSGTLAAGATATVTVSINAAANALTAGSYTDLATFTNTTNGSGNTNRAIVLTVTSQGVLAVTPAGGLTSTGPVGGPFTPSSQAYTLQNTGGAALNWTCAKVQAWTTLSLASGTSVGATATVTVSTRRLTRWLPGPTTTGDVHEHDQRVRQRDPPGRPDGDAAGCSRGHAGRRPHVHGTGRRSVHTVQPGLHAPEHGGVDDQLDGREDANLDVALPALRNPRPRRFGDGGHPDQQPGQLTGRGDL